MKRHPPRGLSYKNTGMLVGKLESGRALSYVFCLIDSFQYALHCILLYLIYNLVVLNCKSPFYLPFYI